VISLAAGIIVKWQSDQAVTYEDNLAGAAELLKKALDEGKISAAAMPGVEGELGFLTSHVAAFENVVEPVVDLEYARKITGDLPVTTPVAVIEADLTFDTWLSIWKAAFGKERGEEGYDARADFNGDGSVTMDDVYLARKWFASKTQAAGLQLLSQGVGTQAPPVDLRSGADPESAASVLAGQGKAGTTSIALAHTPGILAEAASLGQIESVTWTIMDMIQVSALPDIVKASHLIPYEAAVLTPARQHYNALYRPLRPGIQALPKMLARGSLTAEEFLQLGMYEGYDPRWSAAYLNSFYQLPGLRELSIMRWRGLIDDVGFKDVCLRQGWHPQVVDELLNLAWQIPGPGDLIRFLVREVITPEEFSGWMNQQGYGPGWAAAYWDAHFRLPAITDLIDAFHRGRISEAELLKFTFWHDYSPGARPGISISDVAIYRSLTKTLIPRVDLRRAWRLGKLTDAQLTERYGWLGYEDDSELMAEIQKAIALAPQAAALVRMYVAAFRKGTRTEAEVRSKLKGLGVPGPAVDMLIEAETLRREIGILERGEEHRILTTSNIIAAYKKDLFTWEISREILISQGWRPEDAELMLAINTPAPEVEKPVSQIRTAAAALYREGWIEPEDLEGILRAARYSDADIDTIRVAEDFRYRLDYLKDLEAAAIQAFRKDIYTAEELEAYLVALGKSPDRIRPLVAKEIYKKVPKPRSD